MSECCISLTRVGFLWQKAEYLYRVPRGGMKGALESAKSTLAAGT